MELALLLFLGIGTIVLRACPYLQALKSPLLAKVIMEDPPRWSKSPLIQKEALQKVLAQVKQQVQKKKRQALGQPIQHFQMASSFSSGNDKLNVQRFGA